MVSRKRSEAAKKAARTKGPAVMRRAGHQALAGEPLGTVGYEELARGSREVARRRGAAARRRSAMKAVRTKGAAGRRAASRKAARTRAR